MDQSSPTRAALTPRSDANPRRSSAGRSPGSSVLVAHLPIRRSANSGSARTVGSRCGTTRTDLPLRGQRRACVEEVLRHSPASRFTRRAGNAQRTPAGSNGSENLRVPLCVARRSLACFRHGRSCVRSSSASGASTARGWQRCRANERLLRARVQRVAPRYSPQSENRNRAGKRTDAES